MSKMETENLDYKKMEPRPVYNPSQFMSDFTRRELERDFPNSFIRNELKRIGGEN